jgi:selenocysteine lyase/cysteine desulfurase
VKKEAMVRFMERSAPTQAGLDTPSPLKQRQIVIGPEAAQILFHVRDSSRIVFTLNATESINLALKGLLRPKDHVIASIWNIIQ